MVLYSDKGWVKLEIGQILFSTRWRLMQNCYLYRSVELFITDHRLVIASLRYHFRSFEVKLLDLEKLRDQTCKSASAVEIGNRFDTLQSFHSASDRDTFKGEPLEAGRQTIGFCPRSS